MIWFLGESSLTCLIMPLRVTQATQENSRTFK